MLGDMFLWLVANLKQGVIYFIKQALSPNISAGSVWRRAAVAGGAFYSAKKWGGGGIAPPLLTPLDEYKEKYIARNGTHVRSFFTILGTKEL